MSERVEEARETLMEAVDLDTTDCPHCVNGIAALDAYILAVRADERERLRGVVTQDDAERLRAIQFDSTWGAWREEVEAKFGTNLDDAYAWAESLAVRIESLATLPPEAG